MKQVESETEGLEVVDDDDEPDHDLVEPMIAAVTEQTDNMTVGPIGDAVNLRLLPKLLGFLENHDSNTEDQTRILIAASIVSVAKHLLDCSRRSNRTLTDNPESNST